MAVPSNGNINNPFTTKHRSKTHLYSTFRYLPKQRREHKKRGITYGISHGNSINWTLQMSFAYNILPDMSKKVSNLIELACTFGFEINMAKTMTMRVSHSSRSEIKINNNEAEFVVSFCELHKHYNS